MTPLRRHPLFQSLLFLTVASAVNTHRKLVLVKTDGTAELRLWAYACAGSISQTIPERLRRPLAKCRGTALKQRGMRWTLQEVARTGLWVSLVAEMAATAVGDRDAALRDLLG
uniref:Uncharacterized protein n=1 Tax=Rangifer tarandus platyrhynchus TaxID=3082113 RepID=A0ACB0F5H8_RANTA|nr:unnamed protein product [Rangifer tarandus platyrhynchus]